MPKARVVVHLNTHTFEVGDLPLDVAESAAGEAVTEGVVETLPNGVRVFYPVHRILSIHVMRLVD